MCRPDRPAWVIAHRGASRDRPENTFAAFDEALRQGADGIELDVQLTRDGVPVVYHDRTLVKAGGGRRKVAGLDFEELAGLDPGRRLDRRHHGQHIPALCDVLERYGGRTRLFVEIKTREGTGGAERHERLARTVARLLEKMKLEKQTYLLSFDPTVLAAARDESARVRAVLNLKPPRRLTKTLADRLDGLYALSADVRTLTHAFAVALQVWNKPLYVYTCNTRQSAIRALDAGAAGVMSDRPAWLADLFRRDPDVSKHEA